MKIEIVFLCDQEADCKTSPRCGKECIRTTDIEHAKNFAFVSVNEEKSAYIETAVGIAKLSEDAARKFSLQVQTEIGGTDDKTVCHLDSPCPYQTEAIEVKE